VYHVLNRSAGRFTLFRTQKDYLAFENVLQQAIERTPGVRVLSYCVMPNHWHLVLWPTNDADLSAFMFWLTMTHAQRWRTSHDKVGYGPLYQGRFKAFVVQTDAHFLTVCRYVERNPLRANLVNDAAAWRWSSLWRREHGDAKLKGLLHPWPITRPADWLDWVQAPQTAAEEEALQTCILRSRPFGGARWQQKVTASLGLESAFRSPGRPQKNPR
jgi:putative transposase